MPTVVTNCTYIQRLITTEKKMATSSSFKITFKRQDRIPRYLSPPSFPAIMLIINLLMLIINTNKYTEGWPLLAGKC